ncbi:hypothetical protein ABBQ32_003226 [Trebouxia sp. C0010 RCD-2024]
MPQDNHQPDMVIVTEGLVISFGEEACKSMDEARDDASIMFPCGLSPMFYGSIPYLPFYTASGNLVRFHVMHTDGSIADCPATYNLQSQGSLSASCHQSSPSGSSAALTGARQTAAGAPKYGGLTAIPLSQHVYHPAQTPFPQVSVSWDSFVRHHGHSLETVQAAYGVANKCDAMVSTVATWEQNSSLASLPTLHGHVTKYRSDLDRELPHEPYLNTVLWRLGWSCQPYTLTLEEVCKVVQACLPDTQMFSGTSLGRSFCD